MRSALLITYPGLFIIGGLLFLVTLFIHIKRDERKQQIEKEDNQKDTVDITFTEPLAVPPRKVEATEYL